MATLLSGCSHIGATDAEVNSIYRRSAQYHQPDRNPVIVIPGLMGSRLVDIDSGQTVWGAFDAKAADPQTDEGARLMSLTISDDKDLSSLKDNIEPDGVLDKIKIKLFGIPLVVRAYAGILATLGVGGYRDQDLGLNSIDYGDDHFTCFQFDYDWRLSNVDNAQRLKVFIDEKREYVRAAYKARYDLDVDDIKFDIVAHSMGGLIARYFLRYGDTKLDEIRDEDPVPWLGKSDIGRLILVAPPMVDRWMHLPG